MGDLNREYTVRGSLGIGTINYIIVSLNLINVSSFKIHIQPDSEHFLLTTQLTDSSLETCSTNASLFQALTFKDFQIKSYRVVEATMLQLFCFLTRTKLH